VNLPFYYGLYTATGFVPVRTKLKTKNNEAIILLLNQLRFFIMRKVAFIRGEFVEGVEK